MLVGDAVAIQERHGLRELLDRFDFKAATEFTLSHTDPYITLHYI